MTGDVRELETSIIEQLAAVYGRRNIDELITQRDTDIKRFATKNNSMQTPEAIRNRLRTMLVLSIEVMGEGCQDERWRSGVVGAILEGRMSILREVLDWLESVPCTRCGNEISEGDDFCVRCGAAVATRA